jgi:hypothetical protein
MTMSNNSNTTTENEENIRLALKMLVENTKQCSKEELHYLWRRDLLPAGVFEWLRQVKKNAAIKQTAAEAKGAQA